MITIMIITIICTILYIANTAHLHLHSVFICNNKKNIFMRVEHLACKS